MKGPGLERRELLAALCLALVLVAVPFLLQSHLGLDMADEGFLWYGTTQTALGQVPLRDFQSYEPGRYYWGAMFFKAFGPGLLTLRLAAACFQGLGLTCALLALRHAGRNWPLAFLQGALLVSWNYRYYRTYEISFALMAIFAVALVLEKRSIGRYVACGALIGLAGWFGRNLGIYMVLGCGFGLTLVQLRIDREHGRARLLALAGGIALGLAPLLLQIAFTPGFAQGFLGSFKQYVELGRTNLGIPVPWPWVQPASAMPMFQRVKEFLGLRLGFVLLPVFGLVGAILAWRAAPRRPLLAASAGVCLAFSHYAFSRADLEHLSVSIQPMLVGLFTLPLAGKPLLTWLLLLTTGAQALFAASLQALPRRRKNLPEKYEQVSLPGGTFWVPGSTAAMVRTARELCADHVRPGEGIFIAPHWPALYTVLDRRAPLPEIYLLLPVSASRQRAMIQELRKADVTWILVEDGATPRSLATLGETHPLLWAYLETEFQPVHDLRIPAGVRFARRVGRPVGPDQAP